MLTFLLGAGAGVSFAAMIGIVLFDLTVQRNKARAAGAQL